MPTDGTREGQMILLLSMQDLRRSGLNSGARFGVLCLSRGATVLLCSYAMAVDGATPRPD
jgi:hypothetical protein